MDIFCTKRVGFVFYLNFCSFTKMVVMVHLDVFDENLKTFKKIKNFFSFFYDNLNKKATKKVS
jgi:hypothetical protein